MEAAFNIKRYSPNRRLNWVKPFIGFGVILLLDIATVAAQTAKDVSPPGRLGKPALTRDARPPVITLTEPADASLTPMGVRGIKVPAGNLGKITLRGIIDDEGGVASLLINGQNIVLGGTSIRATFVAPVNFPKAGSSMRLEFIATDKFGNTAQQIYEITSTEKNVGPAADTALGTYWALVIGVSEYQHPSVADLDFPVSDAQEIAGVLTQYYTFEPNRVTVLLNPTRIELIGALADFSPSGAKRLGDGDNLLIYYAGHGYWDENYREGYWLPADAEQQNRANWVSNSDVQRAFHGIRARHILLFSDACFSGSLFATRQPFNAAIAEAYREPSRKAITAGNMTDVPDRSVFKEYLIKQLKENSKPYLDAGTLYNSIKEPVTNNSPNRQRPIYGVIQQTGDEGGEFIFVKKK